MKYAPMIYGLLSGLNLGISILSPNPINILVGLYMGFRAYQESQSK